MTVLDKHPIEDRAFVKVHVSSQEVPVHQWSKKYKFGLIREGKRNSLTLPTSLLHQGNTV